jgi:Holliday junction DNA helicase RuvA
VIDALAADQVQARPGGLAAVCGHMILAVECSERDAQALLERQSAEEPTVLFTVLEIEGDRISTPVLVGAASQDRRELYLVLRGLQGIGRRSALAVLDCGEKLDILRAVSGDDQQFFRAVPGLGPKRITAICATLAKHYDGAMPAPLPLSVADFVEVRDALVSSGLEWREAETRILAALDAGAPEQPEELLAQLLGETAVAD